MASAAPGGGQLNARTKGKVPKGPLHLAGRFFKSRFFLVLLILILGYFLLIARLELWDERGIRKSIGASGAYMFEAAQLACATKDQLLQAADRRGWLAETAIKVYEPPENAVSHLRVFVEPEIPFSKEPGRVFHFDGRGCLVGQRH